MQTLISFLFFFSVLNSFSQEYSDRALKNKEYLNFRENLKSKIYAHKVSNNFFEANTSFTEKSEARGYIALTFDACEGRYNEELINFLISENIPATLFLTGKWIDKNPEITKKLAQNSLFEIENHGLKHRICALSGDKKYGLKKTKNIEEIIDEIELNNRKIEKLTGKRPFFYRPAGAYADEICLKTASFLSMEIAGYDSLAGDSFSKVSAKEMSENILKNAKHGMVVLMHLNHPERSEVQALKIAVPILRKKGFSFCHLEDFSLK
ncbi:MAG: polysaccharide deacetylase family protein [Elusimicrobia bacterium]|nr:polysaccharide deacetylase family protein [Elusimicrobiota bacterium]